ncbi:tRNA(Met) cytidine acetate ligase [Dirofilaria immitis]
MSFRLLGGVNISRVAAVHLGIGNREGTEQSNQFIVELDLKRSILYTFIRLQRNLLSECLFDLLFRRRKNGRTALNDESLSFSIS